MPFARISFALFGLLLATTVTAFADLEDYTWSLNGTLSVGETANEVYIAVENGTAFEAASIEVHYDTTVLELQDPLADNVQLVNRASDLTLLPTRPINPPPMHPSWNYVRMTVFTTAQTPPLPDVEVGSGDIARLVFAVKEGVEAETATTLLLTLKSPIIAGDTLAVQEFVVAGPTEPVITLEDHNWSVSGSLDIDQEANEVYIAVENEVGFEAAAVELHYDNTLLEIQEPLADNVELIGRAADLSLLPSQQEGWSYVRMTVFSTVQTPPLPEVEVGSGNIIEVVFKVKDGVSPQATTFQLTTIDSGTVLATKEIEIQGLPAAGDPGDFAWKISSAAMVAGSLETEVFILVTNNLWFSSVVLDLYYDTAVLELKQPLADNILPVRRAAAMNLTSTQEADHVRLTVSGSELDPTTPRIDSGKGTIIKLEFNVLTQLLGGESTSLQLKLSDGTQMAALTITARDYTGPTADVSGDGKEDVFDMLEVLYVLAGTVPPSAFTDVNGDGKIDIWDFIEVLRQLAANR